MFACVASLRSSTPRIVPACITAIRSLIPRISGSSDEIMTSPGPARPASHDLVDFRLRPDVHALRRLVQDQHLRLDRQPARQRHLLLVAAGQRPTGCAGRRRLDPQLLHVASAAARRSGAVDQPAPGHSVEIARLVLAAIGISSTTPCWPPVLRHIARCPGESLRPATRSTGSAAAAESRRNRRASARTASGPARSAPSRPARRCRGSRRARTSKRHVADSAGRGVRPRVSSATSPIGDGRFGKDRGELAADHQPDQLGAVDVAVVARRDRRPSRSTVTRSAIAEISSSRWEM